MQRKGYIIRFIDIGLLILFGFLMISDVKVISRIQLPGNEQEPAEPLDEEVRRVSVFIEPAGRFRIQDTATGTPLFVDIVELADLEGLLDRLSEDQRLAGPALEVVIEPHPDALMQRLVDVHDLCERLGVQKTINMTTGRGGL
jgi:biopolymer transport protein ExbD